ncbi:1,2-phenylacetyl-CoA epoxidase subunit PaaC [Bacillus badius]|uniref:Phenylacetate-CoA oxygenase, PaaI subunit n=1 Tax=Bacillus badius TaxID=1455 RepID=A0ABR5AUR5_BACBA|nr:1,2-phenylacetyl-CoA epoxidase subunit PaaC [Bacillus badius]KIL76354.1 Phenylacetate-CoA oxygenase, PaaI subunit [Bacillus badius]KIL78472.1 Phenylacetate-CoA oxygenase, PaaI subunit [Bacillus badius]KZO00123.1 phenylacetate-CoA oxygenase [Bacillus badius]MED0665456.1 phenylacetate-CoA oxygenase subunit PaaC [Bacillus badius]MED4717468.1 phenylacetate-CoA oxygenase subunit PaaC [Bacillus badius]
MSSTENVLSPEYKEAVTNLLFQLADDDFLISFRGSEWLGLAPHIEEDVASSSISQDTMGHAAMYYTLLEELSIGKADDLAHLRPASERKNSILAERVNGEGYYMETPQYDWAYAVVRNFFYAQAKKVKIDSLRQSSYQPLAETAVKVNMELYYHLLHWKTWFVQLLSSTDEAKQKMTAAMELVMKDFGDVFSYGNEKAAIEGNQLIASEEELKARWTANMTPIFESLEMAVPAIPEASEKNGRNGEHTEELDGALATLSEVYKLDPVAVW